MKHLKIKVYTDGACSGNPGPGGWAALLLLKSTKERKDKIIIKGGERFTTNNRMELQAVIKSLSFIYKNLKDCKYEIEILSDSSYVVQSINSGSLWRWESNGWKTKQDKDIANQDLWRKMGQLIKNTSPVFTKVKGHSGNKFNEYVDQAAVSECAKYKALLDAL